LSPDKPLRSKQASVLRATNGFKLSVSVELTVNMLDVIADGGSANVQLAGDSGCSVVLLEQSVP
jgi:hypothetical protein